MSGLQLTAIVIAIFLALYATAFLQIQKRVGQKGVIFFFSLFFVFLALVGILFFFLVFLTSDCKGWLCNLEEALIWMALTALLIVAFPIIIFIRAYQYGQRKTNKEALIEPEDQGGLKPFTEKQFSRDCYSTPDHIYNPVIVSSGF